MIECLICGNTWTKEQYEAEAIAYFDKLVTESNAGWCPSCGEDGAAHEVGSEEWKAEKAYQDDVRSLAKAEYQMAGRPNKSYREYHEEARNVDS